jgi:AcrR family transcriptional regulator
VNHSLQRRQEEKERRREDLVDAAERVFADLGFEHMTMEAVAREARVSRALVYLYFKDKAELEFAVCERAMKLLHERFEQAVGRRDRGLDQVAAIGRAYVAFATEFPVYFLVLSKFEAHRPDSPEAGSVEHEVMVAGRRCHEVTVSALQQGIQDGSVRSDIGDLMLVALTLWGFIHGCVQLALTKAQSITEEGVAVNLFIEHAIFMAGRAIETPALADRG